MAVASIEHTFPAGNTQDIALTQTTLGSANLVINGNLATSGAVSFTALGYARQVSLTSANNLSAATFTIGGTQNGVVITETIAGPNANSVYSTLVYDTISYISVNAAVANVSIGTGYNGFFNLINIASNLNVTNYTFSLGATIGSNQISTTVYTCLENIASNNSTFSTIITNNVGTLYNLKTVSAESLYIFPISPLTLVPLVTQILVKLTGSTSTISNGVKLTFKQVI